VRAKFRENRSGINAACRSEDVYRHLEHRAGLVVIEAERTAPVNTGRYAFGVGGTGGFGTDRIRVRGRAGVRVTALAPYAAIIELGSRPHVIEARNAQALSWPGGKHPVKRVNHPGTAAQHVLRNALRAAGRL
jgi:hypothetical protein